MKIDKIGLAWLPLFTTVWFYCVFIPLYSYLYTWYGVGDEMVIYTLSASAIRDSPGSISVFAALMGSLNVLFFANKMVWLQIVKNHLGKGIMKSSMQYFFIIVSLLSSLSMWTFTAFYYAGFPSLHNTAASLFFLFELVALAEVAIVDFKYTKESMANNIIRLVIMILAVGAFFALMLGSVMDDANDSRVEREKVTTYDTSDNDLYNNILGVSEIILILIGFTFYGTFVPMFSKVKFRAKYSIEKRGLKSVTAKYEDPTQQNVDVEKSKDKTQKKDKDSDDLLGSSSGYSSFGSEVDKSNKN